MAWQHRIADVIVETESGAAGEAPDLAEHRQRLGEDRQSASGGLDLQLPLRQPPDAVAMNYGLNKVIGDNETGFHGTSDDGLPHGGLGVHPRRRRAVQQPRLLVRRRPRGRHVSVSGDAAGRRQPGAAPADEDPQRLHPRLRFHAHDAGQFGHQRRRAGRRFGPRAGRAGKTMAIYLRRQVAASAREAALPVSREPGPSAPLHVDLPDGQWRAEWIDTLTGAVVRTVDVAAEALVRSPRRITPWTLRFACGVNEAPHRRDQPPRLGKLAPQESEAANPECCWYSRQSLNSAILKVDRLGLVAHPISGTVRTSWPIRALFSQHRRHSSSRTRTGEERFLGLFKTGDGVIFSKRSGSPRGIRTEVVQTSR